MTRPVVAPFIDPPPHFLDDIADSDDFVTALISEHPDDTAALVPEMRLAQHAARDEQGLQSATHLVGCRTGTYPIEELNLIPRLDTRIHDRLRVALDHRIIPRAILQLVLEHDLDHVPKRHRTDPGPRFHLVLLEVLEPSFNISTQCDHVVVMCKNDRLERDPKGRHGDVIRHGVRDGTASRRVDQTVVGHGPLIG